MNTYLKKHISITCKGLASINQYKFELFPTVHGMSCNTFVPKYCCTPQIQGFMSTMFCNQRINEETTTRKCSIKTSRIKDKTIGYRKHSTNSSSSLKKRICIVGAGPSGLTSIKQCMEENFDVICYEKTDNYGGLWRYRETELDGYPSIYKSLVANSSKEYTAFSDFPPPSHYPLFLPNKYVCEYLEMYAKHFDLESKIELNVDVINITFNDDYDTSGKWKITVKYLKDNRTVTNVFDGVLICVGRETKPNWPNIPGKLMHSISYKTPDKFKDKVVAVLGLGNAALDIALDLSAVCSKVYLSSKGKWIVPTLVTGGIPYDMLTTRFSDLASKWLRTTWFNPQNLKSATAKLDHELYGLKPNYEFHEGNPSLNDNIAKAIITGSIVVRKNIKNFTENGVIFEGSNNETKCDAVILATGYQFHFPFIDTSILDTSGDTLGLYKMVFSPKLKHAHTLGVIGVTASSIGLLGTFELQARWFAQLMAENVTLPSRNEMQQSVSNAPNLLPKTRLGRICIQPVSYNDEIAEIIGAKPNLWKLLFTDTKLWSKLIFGPYLVYQYRLSGPHNWSGSRQAIFGFEERFKGSFKATNELKRCD